MAQHHFGRNLRASLGIGARKGTRTSKELEATRFFDHGLPKLPDLGPHWEVTGVGGIAALPRTALSVVVRFSMTQMDFLQLVARVGPCVEDLQLCPADEKGSACDGKAPCADFAAPGVCFPKLRVLRIDGQCFNAIHLTCKETPVLEVLSWEQDMGRKLAYYRTVLPKLRTVKLAFLDLADASGWAASLRMSPDLQHFVAYKLFGLATYDPCQPHRLELPTCTHLVLIRSDDMDHLSVAAPRLKLFNLRGCYNAQTVDMEEAPTNASKFRLVIVNASLSLATSVAAQHSRCTKVVAGDDDSGLGNTEQEERDRHGMWRALPSNSPEHPPAGSYVHVFVERDMFGFTTGKTDANARRLGGNGQPYRYELDHTKVYGRGQLPANIAAAEPGTGWRLWSMDRSVKSIRKVVAAMGMHSAGEPSGGDADNGDADMNGDPGDGARPKAKARAKPRTKATAKAKLTLNPRVKKSAMKKG